MPRSSRRLGLPSDRPVLAPEACRPAPRRAGHTAAPSGAASTDTPRRRVAAFLDWDTLESSALVVERGLDMISRQDNAREGVAASRAPHGRGAPAFATSACFPYGYATSSTSRRTTTKRFRARSPRPRAGQECTITDEISDGGGDRSHRRAGPAGRRGRQETAGGGGRGRQPGGEGRGDGRGRPARAPPDPLSPARPG